MVACDTQSELISSNRTWPCESSQMAFAVGYTRMRIPGSYYYELAAYSARADDCLVGQM